MLTVEPFSVPYGAITLSAERLTVPANTLVQLHGASGSGASEFCLLLAGLLHRLGRSDPAPAGKLMRTPRIIAPVSVMVGGAQVSTLPDVERAKSVGVVFADPTQFFIGDTVLEEFRFAYAAVGLPSPDVHALERYGLFGKSQLQTHLLSGGEKHRMMLASVLELQPRLFVADFSRCNLDSEFLETVISWLRELRSTQVAVVYGLRPGQLNGSDVVHWVVEGGSVRVDQPPSAEFPNVQDEVAAVHAEFKPRSVEDVILRVEFLCRKNVTRPVQFQLRKNEVLQIRGANGVGKTTLGEILAGRFSPREIRGTTTPPLSELNSVMSLQHPESAFLLDDTPDDLLPDDILETCELSAVERLCPVHALPVSRQKLVSVALAAVLSREFVILDEPTAGMDFGDKVRFVRLLNARPELAALIFTHDLGIAGLGTTRRWEEICP